MKQTKKGSKDLDHAALRALSLRGIDVMHNLRALGCVNYVSALFMAANYRGIVLSEADVKKTYGFKRGFVPASAVWLLELLELSYSRMHTAFSKDDVAHKNGIVK